MKMENTKKKRKKHPNSIRTIETQAYIKHRTYEDNKHSHKKRKKEVVFY